MSGLPALFLLMDGTMKLPTERHGADPGYIPIIVTDACGAGNEEAAKRSIESLKFTGDALLTDTQTICAVMRRSAGVSG
jgi:biuret amidohydrolase